MPRIVLCKTPSPKPDGCDAYTDAFGSAGYEVGHLPVLQEEFRLAELGRVLQGGEEEWEAVVMTSKRSAEAWIQAVGSLEDPIGKSVRSADWNTVQLFTVGASSLELLATHETALSSRYRLETSTAIQAKSANELLPSILAHPVGKRGQILILRGDKSMESLQEGLTKGSRVFTELRVYDTFARPTLNGDVASILEDIDEARTTWLAFFSPSSAEMVTDALLSIEPERQREADTSRHGQDKRRRKGLLASFRIAAIGETTARYLVDQGVEVDAVARQPTARGLLEAIEEQSV